MQEPSSVKSSVLLPYKEAKLAGHTHYCGKTPHKCGTNKRYVKDYNCVKCSNNRSIKWTRDERRRRRVHDPAWALYRNAKWRAKKRGLEFTISEADIVIPDSCPCCAKPFVLGAPTGQSVPQGPSLDRFDSSLGYVKNNVAVLCNRCNKLKNDATAKELFQIAEWMQSGRQSHDDSAGKTADFLHP